ncbi:putative PAS/PAC sensor protein [hydrothermal vent metagenome]|uniref:Putative PAS/PAC sensor protein n=1 Tax=hydrothermal vent metagenome TaxID=652676 RepID=A0A3B0VZW4_9ZZZZ
MTEQVCERISVLLRGKIPGKMDPTGFTDLHERKLAEIVNRLIDFVVEIQNFIFPLSRGELSDIRIRPKNFLGSPFKELHSRLVHLTWQAGQVANGDYKQRLDFMGDLSEAFNSMVVALAGKEKNLKKKIAELEEANSLIKRLEGILPICSHCKKIRTKGADPREEKSWVSVEEYITKRTEAQFSHSICPECMKTFYRDYCK